MALSAERLGSTEPEAGQPQLELAYSFLDESFFVETPDLITVIDYDALKHVAATSDSSRLVMTVLQAIGLAESQEALAGHMEQLKTIRDKPEHDEADAILLDHLGIHIGAHEFIDSHIKAAATGYKEIYWNDFSARSGLDSDQLEELYDVTEEYDDCAFLSTFVRLRQSIGRTESVVTANTIYDGERIARLMVEGAL